MQFGLNFNLNFVESILIDFRLISLKGKNY